MSKAETTGEHAEILRVHAGNERICGRFGCAEQLDASACEIDRLRDALTRQTARVDELLASNARLRQTIAQMDQRP
jgi:hypothetical protein